MKNEMLTIIPMNTTLPTFKSAALQKATNKIINIYTDAAKYADRKNREIARILGELSVSKAYEEDGFKSVSEYANTIFGMKKANAYALASAGRIYNNPDIPESMKELSPSKLAELSTLDTETAVKAIESGEISKDSTQKELREYVSAKKPTVVTKKKEKIYIAHPHVPADKVDDFTSSPTTIEKWNEMYMDCMRDIHGECEVINISSGKKSIRYLYLAATASLVVDYEEYSDTPAPIDESELASEFDDYPDTETVLPSSIPCTDTPDDYEDVDDE